MLKVALQFHRVVQKAANEDQRGVYWPVDEKVSRPLHDAIWASGPFATETQMPTADVQTKFRAIETTRPHGVRGDVDQRGDDQVLISATGDAAEPGLRPSQNVHNVALGRCGQTIDRHPSTERL
jgi:hypothetical protein